MAFTIGLFLASLGVELASTHVRVSDAFRADAGAAWTDVLPAIAYE
jgi:hypothetical protein